MLERNLCSEIQTLALDRGKMAFITGPRQSGKTTLAKILKGPAGRSFNWDQTELRSIWTKSPNDLFFTGDLKENRPHSFLILDEIHKARGWKRTLKGMFDSAPHPCKIVVTGSARLNVFKKGGDSLMGRYYLFRLHPFSLGELQSKKILSPDDFLEYLSDPTSVSYRTHLKNTWKELKVFGGFPEPWIAKSEKISRIWQRNRVERLVREDIRDLTNIRDLSLIEMLVSVLPERVGSSLSYRSLREDLEVSFDSIKRWLGTLSEVYYHFTVPPWSRSIPRSLKKEPKLFLWNWSELQDAAARYENMVASHLNKACHYWTDTGHGNFDLYYLKDKEKREVDFLITRNNTPWLPIECKTSDLNPSRNLAIFNRYLKCPVTLQILDRSGITEVYKNKKNRTVVASAERIFSQLP